MTDQSVETGQRGVVIRRLLFRVSIPVAIFVGLSLGTVTFLLASHEEAPASTPGAGTATATATASPAATPSPTTQSSPSPSASPSPPPLVDDPQTGGDQPGTVVPDTHGTRPENTAEEELLGLRDILQDEIDAYVVQTGGIEVGIAVTDLQTGETISVGGNSPHKTGCVINMFALLAAVDRFQEGAASPSWVSSYSIKKGIGGSFPPEVKNFLGVIFGDFRAGEAHARRAAATPTLRTPSATRARPTSTSTSSSSSRLTPFCATAAASASSCPRASTLTTAPALCANSSWIIALTACALLTLVSTCALTVIARLPL
ncbi:MAG: hypothetical protein IIA90_00300 [Chloroflexi bacterium]|nr:hypothetical protein [Chloroflexota bacterium]